MAKAEKKAPAEERDVAAAPEATESAPKKKGGGKLKLIIIVVLAMLIGGGGAFAAMKLLGGGGAEPAPVAAPAGTPATEAPAAEAPPIEAPQREGAAAEAAPPEGEAPAEGEGGEGAAPAEPQGPQNIEFKPFVVNLNDGAGRRFLKLTMSIEAETPELAAEINQKTPQFRDTILLLLSSLSFDDIATLDGKMRLRNQMLNRINTQLTSGKIKNIYFSEFVVQ